MQALLSKQMSEIQRLAFEEDGQIYEIDINLSDDPAPQWDERESMGFQEDAATKMRQAHQMIRNTTLYVLSAFKNISAAEIEEINLKFGLKFGGKTGIPYLTEGSTESNMEISVKCKFPNPQKPNHS